MRIRRADPGEAEALSALIMRSKAHWGYSQQQLDGWRSALTISAKTIARDPVYCAEADGRLAGVMHLKLLGATEVLLDDLFVDPAFIGAGVGAALWRQAVAVAREHGATAMVLDADRHAIPFYQHMGAELVDDLALADASSVSTPRMRYVLPDSPTKQVR
jgi:GNAT superfamily N-acetyltransferase